MIDPSGTTAVARPVLFARHAREALEKHLPEVRTPGSYWHLGTNEAWVRFQRRDGLFGYFALRRHLDWVSGEAGIAREARPLPELFRLPGHPRAPVAGYRIRLGDLIDGKDRWWPAGDSEREVAERLELLALQLAVKGRTYFRRWPGGVR